MLESLALLIGAAILAVLEPTPAQIRRSSRARSPR